MAPDEFSIQQYTNIILILGVENMNYERDYPDKKFQMKWLKNYLEFWHEGNHLGPVTDRHVETLYVQVNKFAPVSLFSLC